LSLQLGRYVLGALEIAAWLAIGDRDVGHCGCLP
jgi:hypothetical protein